MLIQFTVANYRSIKDPVTLSLVASSDSEHPESCIAPTDDSDLRLLKSAAIYGPNAAGKSNLVNALTFMRGFVLFSSERGQRGVPIDVAPFRLDALSAAEPSAFEVVLVINGRQYVYGFSADRERVHEEWLSEVPRKSRKLFSRAADGTVTFGEHWHGGRKTLQELMRSNALFLSVAVQFGNETAGPVFDWFRKGLVVAPSGRSLTPFSSLASQMSEGGEAFALRVSRLLRVADLGISRIELVRTDAEPEGEQDTAQVSLPGYAEHRPTERADRPLRLRRSARWFGFVHASGDGQEVPFDLADESSGTRRLLELAHSWFRALDREGVLVADELERSLHPHLARYLIEAARDAPGVQVIFTTHSTELLDLELLRRDQVWFVEKDASAVTRLHSLSDYHARKDENVRRGYLEGRYGATPIIGGEDPWSPGE